jgi:Icc-related predicted phosphoesterase
MPFLTFSDTHLNHTRGDAPEIKRLDGITGVLQAGDLCDGMHKKLRWLADRFVGLPIYAVLGNHDVWRDGRKSGWTYEEMYDRCRELGAQLGVTVLERDVAIHPDGTRILGCTLQTDFEHRPSYMSRREAMYYAQTGRHLDGHAMFDRRYRMNDFISTHMISDDGVRRRGTRLTPSRFVAEHEKSVSWLEEQLAIEHDAGPTIVLSHHAPTPRSLSGEFDHMACYAVGGPDGRGLEYMMHSDSAPELWVHGHIHNSVDYEVGNTRILSNPRGYPLQNGRFENPNWNPGLVVEIEKRMDLTAGMGI